ncbi:MAG: BamA/TamA family outer membrane protein [Synechococcales bacterium]|nr:BamA/TamA family outer membrane protein [Synechococcales bacterium]
MEYVRVGLGFLGGLAIASLSIGAIAPSPAAAGENVQPSVEFGGDLPFSQGGPADSADTNPPLPSWPAADTSEVLPYPDSDPPAAAATEDLPILPYPNVPQASGTELPILPYPEEPERVTDPSALPELEGVEAIAVTEVTIVGAAADLEQLIREVIQVQPGETVTQSQLQSDVATILGTGFFTNATVRLTPGLDGVAVTYRVEPMVVRSLQLAGAQVLTPDVATEIFAPQIDRPVSPQLLEQRATQIDEWYLDQGYVLSQVVGLLPDPSGVVTIEVVEPVVGDITFRFLDETGSGIDEDGEVVAGRTREDFILRELELQPGDVFNQQTATEDLQELISLGLFEDAAIELSVDEQDAPPTVDLTYSLQERLARSFQVSGGVSTELGLFGAVNYSDQNFRGIGEQLRFGTQVGSRGLNFNTGFTSPYRESSPNRLGYSINAFRGSTLSRTFSDEVPLDNGDDARERRLGGGVSVMRPLGEWDAELGLNYARTSIRDSDGDLTNNDAEGNQLTISDSGIDDLVTVGFDITQDRRLNPLNPSDGSILTLGTEQSLPIGNGSIFMNRLRANYAQYVPVGLLGSGRISNPEVFAFNLQGGAVLGELPPYEAFDLGGTNSIRGYREGEVGSGRTYILASAEYRFPIFGGVGGVLFTDFGSDLGSGNSVQGDPAGERDKPGTGFGYGLGVRIGSPIGLIRADFGFNNNGDSRFHFGFGQRF